MSICILFDYGYNKKIKTLRCKQYIIIKTSIFENIGEQDISSHVNFKELIKIAKQNKLQINEFVSQGDFFNKIWNTRKKEKIAN